MIQKHKCLVVICSFWDEKKLMKGVGTHMKWRSMGSNVVQCGVGESTCVFEPLTVNVPFFCSNSIIPEKWFKTCQFFWHNEVGDLDLPTKNQFINSSINILSLEIVRHPKEKGTSFITVHLPEYWLLALLTWVSECLRRYLIRCSPETKCRRRSTETRKTTVHHPTTCLTKEEKRKFQ